MKKRWLIAPVMVGVLALGVLTAGATMAQGPGSDSTSRFNGFASRVAAILGVDETQVQDAFQQAREDIADEAIDQRTAMLVERGVLTQEQADEMADWLDARPDGLDGFAMLGKGFPGYYGFGPGIIGQNRLDNAVERGVLTQEQADGLQEWLDARPDVLGQLPMLDPGHDRGFGGRHGMRGGFPFGGPGMGQPMPPMPEVATGDPSL